jgi:hypothetical protein
VRLRSKMTVSFSGVIRLIGFPVRHVSRAPSRVLIEKPRVACLPGLEM